MGGNECARHQPNVCAALGQNERKVQNRLQ
jgi:hypothetical protein